MANLKEFFNKISKNNRIFTREDIGSMSSDEFRKNEKAIDFQLQNLGVPKNADMALSNDVVYVHAYTKDDGTKVRAHYRSKHGGITGAASKIDNSSKILQRGVGMLETYPRSTFQDQYSVNNVVNNITHKGLSAFNNKVNANYADARDMMNISINGPQNIKDTDNYKFISSKFNEKLSKELNVKIPKNWDGIVYDVNSNLSKRIANSAEFLNEVAKQKQTNFSNGAFQISLNKDPNLFLSIHNATILNPHIDKDGYFNGLIFDLYDFKHIDGRLFNNNYKLTSTGYNNIAYRLQEMGIIENYYVLIPIKTKLSF